MKKFDNLCKHEDTTERVEEAIDYFFKLRAGGEACAVGLITYAMTLLQIAFLSTEEETYTGAIDAFKEVVDITVVMEEVIRRLGDEVSDEEAGSIH